MVAKTYPPTPWSFSQWLVFHAQMTDSRLNNFHASLVFKTTRNDLDTLIQLEEEWEKFADLYLRYCDWKAWEPVWDYPCGDWTTGKRTLADAVEERGKQIPLSFSENIRGCSF